MQRVIHWEQEARIFAGLPDIHPDIRKLGVGGPSQPLPSEMPIESLIQQMDADVNQLFREAQLEQASLSSIREKVEQNKTYWHHMPTVRPVIGRTTSHFGMRNDPITGGRAPAFRCGYRSEMWRRCARHHSWYRGVYVPG